MNNKNYVKSMKRTFWGTFMFYFLITFEFAYMASPFAAYFYWIYRPALNFFNDSPALAWLISFFLPHAVRETKSIIINIHEYIGGVFTIIGFLGFLFGVFQVYYNKLTKRGAVTRGVYNIIRHPQYASFIICSFGLLLLWPRYIVLIMFITMIFVYYFLAKTEERECVMKFGQSYIDYMNKTKMFFPFSVPLISKLQINSTKSKFKKLLIAISLYILFLAIGISIAKGFNYLTLNNLFVAYTDNSANISICKLESNKLDKIITIAFTDEEVKMQISKNIEIENTKYINYILPAQWYAAEIPMNGIKYKQGHKSPSNYNKNLYKIIFTEAKIRSNKSSDGKNIILNVSNRIPIIEVFVDLEKNKVIKIENITTEIRYKDTPVAIY